jgi:hypothetical protein
MNNQNEDLKPPIVRPTALNFGTLPQGGSITREELISNPNKQQLLWSGDKGETGWLTLTPSAGSLEPGEQQQVNITAVTDSLEVGEHKATLIFTWEGDDYSVSTEVPVTLDIAPVSPLAVGLSYSLFPMSSSTLPLAITNRFDQMIGWTADTGGSSWLALDRSKGTLQPHEQQTIYVTANSSSLTIGDHAATITFAPNVEELEDIKLDDTASKSVQLPVEAHVDFIRYSDNGPKIPTLNPTSFTFKERKTGSSKLVMTNQEGRGRVRWSITGGGVSWVTLIPSSGTFQKINDTATVEVKINTSTLTPTNSTDLLLTLAFMDPPLSSNEPSSAPISVRISV